MSNNVLPDPLNVNVVSPDPLQVELVKPLFSKTAFGELKVESMSPITQISAHLGLLTNVLTVTDDAESGSTTIVDNKYSCQTGAAANGLATILTLRHIIYRPGQGLMARFTALFSTGVADSIQGAGLITSENSYTFGYLGTSFGISHNHDGVNEIRELTLTVPGGAENVTVTINAIAYVVALSGGGTVQIDANEISASLNIQVPNFTFTANNGVVTSIAVIPEAAGAYAYVGVASVGAWVQITSGTQPITDHIAQVDWNVDNRISADPNVNLDPQSGNVYQVQVQYLGFGAIKFFIEDRDTGLLELVHIIRYSNSNTIPSVTNPSFRLGWLVRNGSNTTNVTVEGSSAAGFIEGHKILDTLPRPINVEVTGIGNTDTSLVIVRNRTNFAQKINRTELFPLTIHASSQVNKIAIFKVLLAPVFADEPTFQYASKASSLIEFSTEQIEVTGGLSIATFIVTDGAPQTLQFNVIKENAVVFPGETVVLTATVPSGAAADCQASVSFQEDL